MKRKIYLIIILLFIFSFNVKASTIDSLKIKRNNNTVTLMWDNSSNEDIFIIGRSTKKNGKYKKLIETSDSSFVDKRLTYGKTYYYKVTKVSDKTSNIVKTKIKPNTPTDFKIIDIGSKNIKLSWKKESGVKYVVYRSKNKKKWKKILTTSKNVVNNKKLKTNKTYYYKVRSYKKVNNKKVYSNYSNIVSGKTFNINKEYTKALSDGKEIIKKNYYSKEELLSKLKYSNNIKEYVLRKLSINFKNNALETAKKYMKFVDLSKEELYKQLVNYDKYTKEEANFAIDNIEAEYGIKTSSIENKYKKDLLSLGYLDSSVELILSTFKSNEIEKNLLNRKYPNIIGFLSSDYFNINNIDRYQTYFNKNKYTEKETVLYVEIGLDYEFYTNTKLANIKDGKLILVNKYNYVKKDYNANLEKLGSKYGSGSLNKEAALYFRKMVNSAKEDGIILKSVSAYRSYSTQKSLYNRYVKRDGKSKADRYSARPGYSEHNTGLAVDINTASSNDHFEKTKEYNWLINNSYKYGFILRYPQGKEFITGYKFEPWHFRYFGEEVATKLHELNITYEEYLVINK